MDKYKEFYIPKKSGGYRKILAPEESLKAKQRELLKQITGIGKFPLAYGFIPGKNIVDNAMAHAGKKFILNIDIKDFFTSCKFGRFSGPPGFLPKIVRENYEDIFCEENSQYFLPQGAPTSPFVSNFFLQSADRIILYCLRQQISDDVCYTRYADDITISSNSKAIFSQQAFNIVKDILKSYGFEINPKKIRRCSPSSRQEVTGIVVNSGVPTVSKKTRRLIRAMVHRISTSGGTKKEINRAKGLIAFVMQCPAHREWGIKMLDRLGVKASPKPIHKTPPVKADSEREEIQISNLLTAKQIGRDIHRPVQERVDALLYVLNRVHQTKSIFEGKRLAMWLLVRLRRDKALATAFFSKVKKEIISNVTRYFPFLVTKVPRTVIAAAVIGNPDIADVKLIQIWLRKP